MKLSTLQQIPKINYAGVQPIGVSLNVDKSFGDIRQIFAKDYDYFYKLCKLLYKK